MSFHYDVPVWNVDVMVWRLQNPIKARSRQTAPHASQFQAVQFLLKPKASFVRKSPRHSHQAPEPTIRRLFVSFTVWADCCHGSLLFVPAPRR